MKLIAAVFADFERTALGLPSRLDLKLGDRTVLQHTLRRLLRVEGLNDRLLVISADQKSSAEKALQASGYSEQIQLVALEGSFARRWPLVGAGRWWGLNAWRGGVLGLTWFDEFVEPLAVAQLMQLHQAEGVLCLSAHMPALDFEITSGMVKYQRENLDTAHMTFTMAPPGVAGVILRTHIVSELCEEQALVGVTCSYRPSAPQGDPINRPICYQINPVVSRTPVRLTAETSSSRELLAQVIAEQGEDASAEQFCARARELEAYESQTLPTEITLELTTEHPLPNSTLRPPVEATESHGLREVNQLDALVESLGGTDDRRLVLGGVGDPLQADLFSESVRRLRPVAASLAVETPLIELNEAYLELLFETPIDVLQVQLDAHSAATYQKVHGEDHFSAVVSNLQRLVSERQKRKSPVPLIVPRLTRCAATLAELEVFFDHWISQTGWATIEGYQTWGGLRSLDALFPTVPPQRAACRRLSQRLVLKADGSAWACDALARNGHRLGDWTAEPLGRIWSGDARAELINSHKQGDLSGFAACAGCDQWHRP